MPGNAEAQLTAEGIAATQSNNDIGRKMFLLRVLGTRVSFYFGDLTSLAVKVREGYATTTRSPVSLFTFHPFFIF